MTEQSDATSQPPRRFAGWKRIVIVLAAGAVIVCVGLAAFLPFVVSSDWFRIRAQTIASELLGRRFSLGSIEWRWFKPFRVSGLSLSDNPSFSAVPIVQVGQVHLFLDWAGLPRGHLGVELIVNGLKLHLVRDRAGATNLADFIENIPAIKNKVPELEPEIAPSPLSQSPIWSRFSGIVGLTDFEIFAEDYFTNTTLKLYEASCLARVSNAGKGNIRFDLNSAVSLNGNRLDPIRFLAKISPSTRGSAKWNFHGLSVSLNGNFPGFVARAKTDTAGKSLDASLKLDLTTLYKLARPFVPADFAKMDLAGMLQLDAQVEGLDLEILAIKTRIKTRVSVTDAASGSRLGPVELELYARTSMDSSYEIASLPEGSLRVQSGTTIFWRGQIIAFADKAPMVDLEVGPVRVDLQELLDIARPIISKELKLSLNPQGLGKGVRSTLGPVLSLASGYVSGPLKGGPLKVKLKDLALNIPRITLAAGAQRLSVRNAHMAVQELSTVLVDYFPSSISTRGRLQLGTLQLAGEKPLTLQGVKVTNLRVPEIVLSARNLRKTPKALLGVAGRLSVLQSLTGESVRLDRVGRASNVAESLKLDFTLNENSPSAVSLEGFDLAADTLFVGERPAIANEGLNEKFRLHTRVGRATIRALKPRPLVDLDRFLAEVDWGRLLNLRLKASVADLAKAGVDAEGNLGANLGGLSKAAANIMPKGLKMAGRVDAAWKGSGRLPSSEEIQHIKSGPEPLGIQPFSFIKGLSLELGMKDVSVSGPATTFEARRIDTPEPLRLSVGSSGRSTMVSGKVVADGIRLPSEANGSKSYSKSYDARLDLSLGQEDLASAHGKSGFKLDPLGVSGGTSFEVRGLDRLMKNRFSAPIPTWTQLLGGQVKTWIAVDDPAQSIAMLPQGKTGGLVVKGMLDAGAEAILTPAQELTLQGRLNSSGLDVALPKIVEIENMSSRLELRKRYVLASPEAEKAGLVPARLPLSVEVLLPAKPSLLASQTMGEVSVLDQASLAETALSFTLAKIKQGPLQIALANQAMTFRLDEGLPRVDFFQVDLLGGNLRGAFALSPSGEAFSLGFQTAFSGLDLRRLAPGLAIDVPASEAEISGQVALTLPVNSSVEDMLQGLRLDVTFTQIGSRALERILYSLDPYESNQAMVENRRRLKMASPRWIRCQIQYGTLSLEGELGVMGAIQKLPAVSRVDISNVLRQVLTQPGMDATGENLAPVLRVLEAMSAKVVEVKETGEVIFRSQLSPNIKKLESRK